MAQQQLGTMSTDNLVVWIMTLPGKAETKQKACNAIIEEQITGDQLLGLARMSDLSEIKKFPALFRKTFWDGIVKLKGDNGTNSNNKISAVQQQAQLNKNSKLDSKLEQLAKAQCAQRKQRDQAQARAQSQQSRDSYSSDTSFFVPFVHGSSAKKTKIELEPWNTVYDLKQAIVDAEGGDISDLSLKRKGKPLDDNKTLKEYGINKHSVQPVLVTFRVVGGMCAAVSNDCEDEKNEDAILRIRLADFTNTNIKPSFEADCIMGFDEKDTLRVKMPCGHVFDPFTIYKFVESQLDSHYKTEICCPMEKCGTEWIYGDIVSAADLDEKEQSKLASVLESRALLKNGNFKQCPGCSAMVEKPDGLYMLRVHCQSQQCKAKPDFCWLCAQAWKGGGFAVCGNNDCHTAIVNEELKIENCGTTNQVMSRDDVQCPKLRACPRCLALVGYKADCKHMRCWHCKDFFCFICLALGYKDDNNPSHAKKWDCEYGNSYDGQCKLAPVQNIK